MHSGLLRLLFRHHDHLTIVFLQKVFLPLLVVGNYFSDGELWYGKQACQQCTELEQGGCRPQIYRLKYLVVYKCYKFWNGKMDEEE